MICNEDGVEQKLGARSPHNNDKDFMFPYLSKSDLKTIDPTEEEKAEWRSRSTFSLNELIPCVIQEWSGHFLISGATGSGKTWIAKEILKHSDKAILLVSDIKGRDPSLKLLKRQNRLTRINTPQPVRNTFVLFDDVRDENMNTWRDKLLEQGRHAKVTVLTITHNIREGIRNRQVIQDSEWIILFPRANKTIVNNYLADVLRIPSRFRNLLLQLAVKDGRYLFIHNWAPTFFMTSKSIIPF